VFRTDSNQSQPCTLKARLDGPTACAGRRYRVLTFDGVLRGGLTLVQQRSEPTWKSSNQRIMSVGCTDIVVHRGVVSVIVAEIYRCQSTLIALPGCYTYRTAGREDARGGL
jgi:hypothetical protein